MEHVVTRYAPSPTGYQHIGGIRTALFAYLWARKNNGTFILRIEDTDLERKVEGAIEHTKEALTWAGISWDYGPDTPGPWGPNIQSERLSVYKGYAERLVAEGKAYPDPYTAEELAAFRKQAEDEKRPFLFRHHRPATFEAWDGTKPLRLKVENLKRYVWNDVARGKLEAGEEALDDFILMKSDGYPTYNFAHIVDDHIMGVTHVMRADEFISSMPRFLSLYDALGIPRPVFVTLPPILREDRTKKLGKRDGAKDILEYRADGYLPEAMVNYLALLGWNPGTDQELFTMEELIEAFEITKIQKAGAAFDEEKLNWFNREHLKRAPDSIFVSAVTEAISQRFPERTISSRALTQLTRLARERSTLLSDIGRDVGSGEYDFAFVAPEVAPEMIKWKKDESPKDALPRLMKVAEILASIEDSEDPETYKIALMPYAEEVGKGEVLWPLRVALSGRERSSDPFTLIAAIGIPEALERVKKACATIS